MGQLIRQIGIVTGLTVILTFPVTVVSGGGSQKQSDRVVSFTVAGAKGQSQETIRRTELGRHEFRR
jgi:hypothetical protein